MEAFLGCPPVLTDHQRGVASRGSRLRCSAGKLLICRQVMVGGKLLQLLYCGKIQLLGFAFNRVAMK